MARQHPSAAARSGPASRRALLLGAAGATAAALTGCSGGTGPVRHPGAPTPSALPPTTPWRPSPSDVRPAVKLRAVQVVEALGAWPPGGAGAAHARARVAALGLPAALAGQAGPLAPEADAAALQVVTAQYGGVLADSASVLVVCRQWTRSGAGSVTAGGTTVDVRLRAGQPRWTVTELRPARPGPPAATLPEAARRVLAEPRIALPPAAADDIRAGTVHGSVLAAMLTLARRYRIDVSVVRSGHPLHVFGTDRPSDHPRGRAFDVWRVDGHPVVDPATPRSLIAAFMRDAAAAGSYNVGGPVALSGGATPGQFFTDDTHHDHVHVGFDH
ncbi:MULTISPECIES: hypothetical protein [Streptomycetaceae]|uniref:Lipoprotein n=1 Tax=Streptantibioticus cattleyicolor (strain ATCC 35852 / DSM 46488 / JCM 4925 / NBRC 14057 / NRRL 8057) TaxID=1003195 RepID=F8JW44_STREN|nr:MULTISPECIES: hypothetical protein [Streptomycetaceae]AEW93213.1 hypothetical protein SCATT_08420 [Streptantibioticus cattleyicolor NRRL 8057 = DSM 46488]MYS57936.1 hypothetical protein [Streptomyces sp. SID5468]CCB73575.1 conserved exported protein of unknown function [Streptantibioticus cattleyicolor NRRL 8057 = DSM 46488]